MGNSNLSNKDELEIQRKRITELEKVNKELRAENMALNWDITKRKRAEDALGQNDQSFGLKLETHFSPSINEENFELSDIIDIQAVQSLMDDFYKFAHITIVLLDLKGNVLVSVGWQDICTKFHRVHPETCKHCVESDTKLSSSVPPGEFKLYRCKNNMWDIVTPIMIGGQHIGNIFSGQFFFEDEPVDYELFRVQARKYGFNEEEYIAALEKVPRLSRDTVETSMSFFMKLANMISQLGHSNIKLAQSLEERNDLVEALQESEKRERARSDELAAVLDTVPVAVYTTHDPKALKITGNRLSYEWLRVPAGTNFSKSAPEGEKPEFFKLFKDGVELPPEKMPSQMAAAGKEINDCELDIVSADGYIRHVLGNARPLRDEKGNLRGSVSAFIDITERKQLEEKTRQRAEELETIMEVVPTPILIGHDTQGHNITGNQMANEFYEARIGENISARIPKGRRFFCRDRELTADELPVQQAALKDIDLRNVELDVLLPSGKLRTVTISASPLHDAKGHIRGSVGAFIDITERKEAEAKLKQTLDNLEELVEQRTDQLEEAYRSLKKSEISLAESQKMAHLGNWEQSFETNELHWSDEMYRIFGLKPQEFEVTYDIFLNCYVHPDDRDFVDNAVKKAFNGRPFGIDYRIVLDDGRERVVHGQGEAIFDDKNTSVVIRGTAQDITEHKKAEEKIQTLADAVESSNDAIVTESLDCIITSWNKGAEQIYGYSAEEVIGKNVSILEPDSIKGEIKKLVERVKQGERIQHHETLRLKKDSTIINVSLTLSPIFNTYGKFVAISAIARDITDRKKAEDALLKIEVVRQKEIHHRIKNNLQVISSLLDLTAEKFNNRECVRDSEIIEAFRESQDRVTSIALIHEELHKGAGEEALNFSLYLKRLTEGLLQTYSLGNTDISLNLDLEENIFFDMDIAVPLGMIVNELISNSLKYAFPNRETGEVQVKLFSEKSEDKLNDNEGKSIEYTLIVLDNGIGIPEKIDFKNSNTLGLQLVNLLVDQLNGKIGLKREKGTEFGVTFSIEDKL